MTTENKLSFTELVETFGKPTLRELFKEKIREFQQPGTSRFTMAQRDYLAYRMGPDAARWAIEIGETRKKAQGKAKLAYWCRLYLRVTDGSRLSNKLTDAQIQQAREYPTHELYNGRLIRSGCNFKAKCPFHDERTPSFYFYTKDGSYHCFGCAAHGSNAIDYLMQSEKLTFQDAVRRLA